MADFQVNVAGRELQFGRYDLKIEALRRAQGYAVNPQRLYRSEFEVTRELDVSEFVLTDFLRPLGLPREEYCGFALVERLIGDSTLGANLARLAAQLSDGSPTDESPETLLVADAIARGDKAALNGSDAGGATLVLLGRARAQLAAGQVQAAFESLGAAIRNATYLRDVNALLGALFQRRGNMPAAASAYHVSLLNLGPASGLNRPFGIEMDYKGYRILQLGRRFCALPRWRDARVTLVQGKPTIIAHRLPQSLRRWILRRAPRAFVEWARRHLARYLMTAELDPSGVIEAEDLVAVMRRIDAVATQR